MRIVSFVICAKYHSLISHSVVRTIAYFARIVMIKRLRRDVMDAMKYSELVSIRCAFRSHCFLIRHSVTLKPSFFNTSFINMTLKKRLKDGVNNS